MNLIPQQARDRVGTLLDPLALLLIRWRVRPNLITTVGTLGLWVKVGSGQRGERVLLVGVPTAAFGGGSDGALLFWIVVVLAFATSVTVVERVVYVARVAGDAPLRRPARPRDTVPGRAPALHIPKGP